MNNLYLLIVAFSVSVNIQAASHNPLKIISQIRQKIEGCSASNDLLTKVTKLFGHKPKLSILPYKKIGWSADCSPTEGAIRVAEELTLGEMIGAAIFELANLSQNKKINNLYEIMCSLKQHQYAFAVEEIEFESSRIHDKILDKCPNILFLSDAPSKFNFKNLDESLCAQEQGNHTARIRARHERNCGKQKDPGSKPKLNCKKINSGDLFSTHSYFKKFNDELNKLNDNLKKLEDDLAKLNRLNRNKFKFDDL